MKPSSIAWALLGIIIIGTIWYFFAMPKTTPAPGPEQGRTVNTNPTAQGYTQ